MDGRSSLPDELASQYVRADYRRYPECGVDRPGEMHATATGSASLYLAGERAVTEIALSGDDRCGDESLIMFHDIA